MNSLNGTYANKQVLLYFFGFLINLLQTLAFAILRLGHLWCDGATGGAF